MLTSISNFAQVIPHAHYTYPPLFPIALEHCCVSTKQSMTCSVHSHCGCFVYNCLLEAHLHPGAHCTIPWLLIVDSRCVYPYTSPNTHGYSLWTLVLAPRSSLSRPTKWLVHFLSPRPLSQRCIWPHVSCSSKYHTPILRLATTFRKS